MRVYRSPVRLFLFGVLGLLLMIAAVDVMFVHRVSTPPDNTDGVLTTRGLAQQRGDFVWGAAMIAAGTLMFGIGITELVRRTPLLEVGEEGITAAIGTSTRDVVIPWSQIDSVSSGVIRDPFDGGRREQLLLELHDVGSVPRDVVGATWAGSTLSVDAHEWTKSVTEVMLAAQGALDYNRRIEAIAQMEPPSLVWEVKVSTGDDVENSATTEESE